MDGNEGVAFFTSPKRSLQILGRGTLAIATLAKASDTVHKLLTFIRHRSHYQSGQRV